MEKGRDLASARVSYTEMVPSRIARCPRRSIEHARTLEFRLGTSRCERSVDRSTVSQLVVLQLAADFACEPRHLLEDGVTVVEARRLADRRRFPWREKRLALVTMGRGVVVCCDAERCDWAREHLLGLARDELFSAARIHQLQQQVAADGQRMEGPVLKFACANDQLTRAPKARDLACELELFEGDQIDPLYDLDEMTEPLGSRENNERPDVLAVAARADGRVVGLAGASADSDALWQIGVEVAPDWRGRGIAVTIVHALTRAILERGRVPYYSTYVSHLASSQVARSVGYWLSWVELDERDVS